MNFLRFFISINLFLMFSVSYAADLTVGNNQTFTISSNASYDNIILRQNSTLNILSGVDVTANNLNVLNNATINLDGTLNLTGNVDVSNGAGLTVNNTGVMDVDGNVTAGNTSTLDFGGTVNIDGDLDADKTNIIVDGNVSVGGTFTGTVDSGAGTLNSGNNNNYNNPLPVVLLSANAQVNDDEVILNWTTSAEINNDYFSVKVSRNMHEWELVDQVSGVGNSSSINTYEYSFTPELNGSFYVQLSQTDYDGTHEILKVMNVHVSNSKISIYPMPLKAGQHWHIRGLSKKDKIRVFNNAMIPVENYNSLMRGIYYVMINNSEVHKLIVQ